MRICSVHNCDYSVFGTDKRTGKGFCKGHQFLRVDKPPKKRKSLKRTPIRRRSIKRTIQEEWYGQICDEIDKELQEAGEFRCFFTNTPLIIGFNIAHHHCKGRDGDLLTEKKWIKPCLNWAHLYYHDLSVEKLSRFCWYKGFLQRLKELDEGLYNKEINKKDKS